MDLPAASNAADAKWGVFGPLYAEELGLVIEVSAADSSKIVELYKKKGVSATIIGKVSTAASIVLGVCHEPLVSFMHIRAW